MPGVTMTDPVPEGRMSGEVGGGIVPGYYLSDTTQQDPDRDQLVAANGLFDTSGLLPIDGLSVGGRWIAGGDETGYFEPMVRYRMYLDEEHRISTSIVAFGTFAKGSANGASYEVGRGGAEFSTDIRITPPHDVIELHVLGGASATVIGGSGDYCMDEESGYGIDCGEGELGNTTADLFGVYPSAFVGFAVDLGNHLNSAFHGVRLGGYTAGGTMPRIRFAEDTDSPESWFTWGGNLSVSFGAVD